MITFGLFVIKCYAFVTDYNKAQRMVLGMFLGRKEGVFWTNC